MDSRLRDHVEAMLGCSVASFPTAGVQMRPSEKRADIPGQRLRIHRIPGNDAAVATGTEAVVHKLARTLEQMQPAEIFSPFGIAEIRRLLGDELCSSLLGEPGLDYSIATRDDFQPAAAPRETIELSRDDIPRGRQEFELEMSEQDASPPEKMAWAFVSCEPDDWASIAVIRWHDDAVGSISIAGTKPTYQRKGHGRAAVSAATDYILAQGRVATYGTVESNIPALRMIRPLGYQLAYETIYA